MGKVRARTDALLDAAAHLFPHGRKIAGLRERLGGGLAARRCDVMVRCGRIIYKTQSIPCP